MAMDSKKENRAKGASGEEEAVRYLRANGYRITERNWTAGKLEVDIVAKKGRYIVFIEVKTRFSKSYGEPWEAVRQRKRQNIIRAADIYIQRKNISEEPRFDIISIVFLPEKTEIEHFEGAFWPTA